MRMPVRAFITGISGFAGSHLAEFLLENTDWEVSGLIRTSPGNVAHLQDKIHLVKGDLRDYSSVESALAQAQPDYIFHLAAMAFVPDSWRDPWGVFENKKVIYKASAEAMTPQPYRSLSREFSGPCGIPFGYRHPSTMSMRSSRSPTDRPSATC